MQNNLPFQQIFESVPGLYLILNTELYIVAVSDEYLRATLTKRNEILDRHLFDVFPDNPDDPGATGVANLHASLRHVLQYKVPHVMAVQQYDIRRSDGSFEERHWSPQNKPVFDTNGNVTYIIHRAEDVTQYVKTQQRLSEMETEIYKRAQEIQEYNRRLEEANKELEAFTYSVSHDLRSPLRVIDGYANMLAEDIGDHLTDDARQTIGTIKNNARRMGQLIDDLLAFSHTGRKELSLQATSMSNLVESVIRDLSPGRAAIHTGNIESTRCDPALIRQVWINLVGNAIKYSSQVNTPAIQINSEIKDQEVIYTVSDNGAGFNMKYVEKLFGVFQRLHKPTEFEGTGIGLALCARIVKKHGGKIWAQAEEGKGATFSFSLPYKP